MKVIIPELVGEIYYIWQMNSICECCKCSNLDKELQICIVRKTDNGLIGTLVCAECSQKFKIGDKIG